MHVIRLKLLEKLAPVGDLLERAGIFHERQLGFWMQPKVAAVVRYVIEHVSDAMAAIDKIASHLDDPDVGGVLFPRAGSKKAVMHEFTNRFGPLIDAPERHNDRPIGGRCWPSCN